MTYTKGTRTINENNELTEEELAKKVQEFVLESTEEIESTDRKEIEKELQDMMTSQEYLREERIHVSQTTNILTLNLRNNGIVRRFSQLILPSITIQLSFRFLA